MRQNQKNYDKIRKMTIVELEADKWAHGSLLQIGLCLKLPQYFKNK